MSALDSTTEERTATLEALWQEGGLKFVFGSYRDLLTDIRANDLVSDFVRKKIKDRINDDALAEKLIPYDHPFGSRRPIVDTEYFETYRRDNVTLVDLRKEEFVGATATGLQTAAREYEVDVIVFATGFDAVTGPFLRIDIRGRGGLELRSYWADGPRSYLGLMIHDFPNLFTITGPGSTFGNHAVTMEHQVEWIAGCIGYMRRNDIDALQPTAAPRRPGVRTCSPRSPRPWCHARTPGGPAGTSPANPGDHCSPWRATSITAAPATASPPRDTSTSSDLKPPTQIGSPTEKRS